MEYRIDGAADEVFRLATTLLDPQHAPATELAALYHERWESENAYDEVKTHLLGSGAVLRSKTPELVRQEVDGLMMAYYAVRRLIHAAARQADEDPDRLSFVHAVRVIRRRIQNPARPILPRRAAARNSLAWFLRRFSKSGWSPAVDSRSLAASNAR